MTNYEILKEYEAHQTPVPSYDEWIEKDKAMTALLAEYGKVSRELQEEKVKHMTRPSLRSPADEMVIEKQVWESTLNRSMKLQAENAQLKELLKESKIYVENFIEGSTIINEHHISYILLQRIKEALR